MSNLLTRLKNVIMADLNELLDKKEQQNPIALLNEYLRQCEQEVKKVERLIERQRLLKDELAKEYYLAQKLAEKRKYQAEIALKAQEPALHQFAANEENIYHERAQKLKESLKEAAEQIAQLEQKYEKMKHQVKDMQIRRMELMGRENTARANYRIHHVLEENDLFDKTFSRFSEIEYFIDRLEKKVNDQYFANTFDEKIAKLEKELKNKETDSKP